MIPILISILEVAVSVVFFANKLGVLIEKRLGWLIGVIAAALAILYFFFLNLVVFMVLEVGLVILMGYGYWKKEDVNVRVEWFIRIAITVVMGFLTYFVFAGFLTIMEFIGSVLMLWGTYFLTHKKVLWGWVIYGVSHVFATIVGYGAEQPFFAHFQIASAMVAGAGVIKEMNRAASKAA